MLKLWNFLNTPIVLTLCYGSLLLLCAVTNRLNWLTVFVGFAFGVNIASFSNEYNNQ